MRIALNFGSLELWQPCYCKAIDRTPSIGHDVKSCWVIPKEDKHNLIKAFSVLTIDSDCSDSEEISEAQENHHQNVKFVGDSRNRDCADIQRVECFASPIFFVILENIPVKSLLTPVPCPI